jgi:hypothetical protein
MHHRTVLCALSADLRALLLAVAGCTAAACTFSPSPPDPDTTKVAYTDRLRVVLDTEAGAPTSGEARGLPEVVYVGRFSRLAVTVTDSDVGLPVGPTHVAAKVIATTWVSPSRVLEPVAPEKGLHAGFLEIPTRGPYRIDVEVEWPGGRSYLQFGFDY